MTERKILIKSFNTKIAFHKYLSNKEKIDIHLQEWKPKGYKVMAHCLKLELWAEKRL